ncbi:hypothetical protein K3495_g7441 [Podosphaera aphanis]|nr:hypothetical protein K3495_g7441 [Podosphaera aphanis]
MPRKSKTKAKSEESDTNEDLIDTAPIVEPYSVLGLENSATADEIKSAYRKAALRHHPDKAPAERKDEAHIKFQEIAAAYAVLSDPVRRERYDLTGSTSESLSSDQDFSWVEFFKSQFKDAVNGESIAQFTTSYKKSDEEKDDLLAAYTTYQGKWEKIYEVVMLSDPLEDEDRFRDIIDNAIKVGDVDSYKAYTEETDKAKKRRINAALKERKNAAKMATKAGKDASRMSDATGGDDTSSLQALILKNQAGRSSFLDSLEAKYAALEKEPKAKKGRKRPSDEPSEEAFLATQARMKLSNGGQRKRRKV